MGGLLFSRRNDGQVDAVVEGYVTLNEALADCISSLPPRGAESRIPSTYWIDAAYEGARSAVVSGDSGPFLEGNMTYLRVDGDYVVASLEDDVDEEFSERMPIEIFFALLKQWRDLVIAAQNIDEKTRDENGRPGPRC